MTRFFKSGRYCCLKCFLLGAGFALPYLVPQLFVLTYAFLTAFVYFLLIEGRMTRLFRYAFCFLLGFYIVLYSFLASMYPFDGFSFTTAQAILIATGACTLIPLLHTLIHSVILLPLKLFKNKIFSAVLLLPCLWAVAEWALEYGILGFPWGKLALSQTSFLAFLQTESLLGPYFITLIIVLFSSLTAYAIAFGDRAKALAAVAILGANMIVGTVLYLVPAKTDGSIHAAALQGNVSTKEKWSNDSANAIYSNYDALISSAAEDGAQLIVLPESAVPVKYTAGGRTESMLKTASQKYNAVLLCGVTRKEEGDFNSVIAVDRGNVCDGIYDKRHLTPFGEFIPFREQLYAILPMLSKLNLSGMTLSEGESPVVFDTAAGKIGTLICFDSLFPQLTLDEVKDGAQIMTVVTNDSWFKDSAETYQHARMAQLRAIECGRYFIQAGNTGVSEIVDNKGRVLISTDVLTRGMCSFDVCLISENTLYTYIGDLALYLAAAFILIMILINIGERIYDHKKHKAV